MDTNSLVWIAVVLLIVLALGRGSKRQGEPYPWLYIVFFLSGFPALIYQIVWQRALFSVYGVNIESVTIVVTAFMLGLGLGSLFGGQLSKTARLPLLAIFGMVELGIAVYGAVSLHLFHWVASFTAGSSLFKTSIVTFLLVLVPTVLMGCTLPLLVAHLVRTSKSVGRSVGSLYFVNTLGSAIACFIAANITMKLLGQSGSVLLAALVNVCIGSAVLLLYLYSRRQGVTASPMEKSQEDDAALSPAGYIRFPLALAIAAFAGFIALGYEILWYRVFAFTTEGLARSFAVVLGSYLAGVAFGASAAERFCKRYGHEGARRWVTVIALLVIVANVAGFLVIPFLAYTSRWLSYQATLPLVGLAAGLLGAVFPLVAHAAIPPDSGSGVRLSYLYLANIIGSASGSFLVGFIAMDLLPLPQIAFSLALTGILSGLVLLMGSVAKNKRVLALSGGVALSVVVTLLTAPLFSSVYARLCFKTAWSPDSRFNRFDRSVETKSGVVTVTPRGLVYGDGSIEAHISTDLKNGDAFNFVLPPYALSSFDPHPGQVLMIGLGIGAWAEIIANHPEIEKLTIVEINPGYLQLIAQYPQVAELLKNPKVEIAIDDARRWLLQNPERRFDALVMNTRLHWRSNTSNILSVEFLQLVRRHLKPGGIMYYNVSWSPRALLTGATVFPYALRVRNCLAVSDSPIEVDRDRWRNILVQYRLEGKPVFNMEIPADRALLERLLSSADPGGSAGEWEGMEYGEALRKKYHGLRLITDDNMGDEWFH